MLNLLKALRKDEHGVILSTEIVIVGSLLVIGMITGLTCLQKSVNGELRDVASAIGALDQSYSYASHRKTCGWSGQCCAWTAGSSYVNCEQQQNRCGDLAGCEGTVPLRGGDCHDCTSTIGIPLHSGGCGVCGGAVGGCSSCSIAGSAGPFIRETGVPGMKVTEWPSSASDCPIQTCPTGSIETLTIPVEPVPQHGVIHEDIEFIGPGNPAQPDPHDQSAPLAPMPNREPLPAPAAPPSTTSLPQSGVPFNFPGAAFN